MCFSSRWRFEVKATTQGAWCLLHVEGVKLTWQHVVGGREYHAGGMMTSARRGRADVAEGGWLFRVARGGVLSQHGGRADVDVSRGGRDESARGGVLTRGKL
ncbi:hypothetical protein AHAS_Ahas08G0027600 [Arachis hypogaea]